MRAQAGPRAICYPLRFLTHRFTRHPTTKVYLASESLACLSKIHTPSFSDVIGVARGVWQGSACFTLHAAILNTWDHLYCPLLVNRIDVIPLQSILEVQYFVSENLMPVPSTTGSSDANVKEARNHVLVQV